MARSSTLVPSHWSKGGQTRTPGLLDRAASVVRRAGLLDTHAPSTAYYFHLIDSTSYRMYVSSLFCIWHVCLSSFCGCSLVVSSSV